MVGMVKVPNGKWPKGQIKAENETNEKPGLVAG
jgi:hypothetical protein